MRLALLALTLGCAAGPRIAPSALARLEDRTPVQPGEIEARWLGAAGFELRGPRGTLLLDPFLSRPTASEALLGRVVPDRALLARALPEADLVAIGHSHFEHVMDAAAIAARTGGRVLGTRTTCHIVARMGLEPARCTRAYGGLRHVEHGFDLVAVPSRHVDLPGIGVPIDGKLDRAPGWTSPSAWDHPEGGALAYVIRAEGLTIVHLSSAGLPADPTILERAVPEGADVVLAAAPYFWRTPGYLRKIITYLSPRLIVPHHFDPLFGPLPETPDEETRALLARFGAAAAGAEIEVPRPMAPMRWQQRSFAARPRARLAPATDSGFDKSRSAR